MDKKEYSKNYRDLNKEEIKLYKKKWYQENKNRLKEKSKNYYQENKESILKKRKIYFLEKYGDDMNSQIKKNVLSKVIEGLKNGYWSTEMDNLLGYTLKDLKDHLKIFDFKKMHVHHIVPVRVYNFYNEEDIKKCWSLRNIVPFWDEERSNDIDWDIIEEKQLEDLLPDTLLIDDMIGRHYEV